MVVIFYSNDDQISDRSYRIGQKKNVIIYRLIPSETIEEYVYRTQVRSFLQPKISYHVLYNHCPSVLILKWTSQLFKAGAFKAVAQENTLKRYVARKVIHVY